MIGRFAVTFVLLAVPALGQSRVYTNADLGKIQRTHNATEEELAGLRAHQFVLVPDRPAGPEVIVVHSSTAEGPYGEFALPAREPLDTTFVQSPWIGGWGHRVRGPVTARVPNLSAPAPITVPEFARGPIAIAPAAPTPSTGRRRR